MTSVPRLVALRRIRRLIADATVAARIRSAIVSSIVAATIVCGASGGLGGETGSDDRSSTDGSRQEAAAPTSSVTPDDPARPDIYVGRVLSSDDRPLAGVRLYLVESNESPGSGLPPLPPPGAPAPAVRAVSDASGRFRFSAPDMTDAEPDGLPARHAGLLVAAADGYGPDWIKTAQWKGVEYLLKLPRDDAPIRGRLLDKAGRPVVGASVRLMHLDVPKGGDLDDYIAYTTSQARPFVTYSYDKMLTMPWAVPDLSSSAVTDGEGRFRLKGLGRERLAEIQIRGATVKDTMITVMTSDAVDRKPMPRAQEAGRIPCSSSFALRLEAGRTVTGIVRDRQTGHPVGGMWVASSGSAWGALAEGRGDFATDADGRFAVTGLSPHDDHPTLIAVPQPGSGYFMGQTKVDAPGAVVINCPRGIPYTLRIVDEQGAPVQAGVTYYSVYPNPNAWTLFAPNTVDCRYPLSRGARQADGTYRGTVLPGPGVVLAKTPRRAGYRPAHVDPKLFFAPGKTDWSGQDLLSTYGNHDWVSITHLGGAGSVIQHDYAAIVLVNAKAGSGPLSLSATVVRDRPRQVTLVDPEGKPVVGALGDGVKYHYFRESPRLLRSATFPLVGLHPDRAQRMVFVHEPRKLSGMLLARGDGETPYTVRLLPWSSITGRLVDGQGNPMAEAVVTEEQQQIFSTHDDPTQGRIPDGIATDRDGRFCIDRLVPGVAYSAQVYWNGSRLGTAFREIKVAPGRIRDLGDVRLTEIPDQK